MWANYSTDQKNFTGHIHVQYKIRGKVIYKMSFKALPVKMQRSKNRQGRGDNVPGQIGLNLLEKENILDDQVRWKYLKYNVRKLSVKFLKA